MHRQSHARGHDKVLYTFTLRNQNHESVPLRLSDYIKDDCSASKLLCFSLIIGDFYNL